MRNYRIDPAIGVVYGPRGKPMRKICGGGYVQVTDCGRAVAMAHRMIFEYVYGPIPSGMQINHKNGIKTDNRIENLEIVTPSENTLHAYRLGLSSAVGEKNGRAKLSESIVREIRKSSEDNASLARLYCVSRETIRSARVGETWAQA